MMRALDSLKGLFYKARPLGAVVAALWMSGAAAEVVNGAQLPDGVQKVGENRYRAPGNFDKTMDYYKSVYPASAFPRRMVVNQPGVKALHIVNPSGKNFEGLNIYEANDEVRIFIVRAEAPPAQPMKAPPAQPVKKPADKKKAGKKSR